MKRSKEARDGNGNDQKEEHQEKRRRRSRWEEKDDESMGKSAQEATKRKGRQEQHPDSR